MPADGQASSTRVAPEIPRFLNRDSHKGGLGRMGLVIFSFFEGGTKGLCEFVYLRPVVAKPAPKKQHHIYMRLCIRSVYVEM